MESSGQTTEEATVNEDPDVLQPRQAALGVFEEDAEVDDVLAALTETGIAADSLHAFAGEAGLEAYKGRAPSFARLFDDTDERMVDALYAGRSVVMVFDVPEDRGDDVRDQLKEAGATETIYFGKRTHEG